MLFIFEIDQCVQGVIAHKHNTAAPAAITTGRAPVGHKFFPAESDHPVAAVAGFSINFDPPILEL